MLDDGGTGEPLLDLLDDSGTEEFLLDLLVVPGIMGAALLDFEAAAAVGVDEYLSQDLVALLATGVETVECLPSNVGRIEDNEKLRKLASWLAASAFIDELI